MVDSGKDPATTAVNGAAEKNVSTDTKKTPKAEAKATAPKEKPKVPAGYCTTDEARQMLGYNSNGGVYPWYDKKDENGNPILEHTRVDGIRGRLAKVSSVNALKKRLEKEEADKQKEAEKKKADAAKAKEQKQSAKAAEKAK